MKVITISKKAYSKLEPLVLPREIFNTEAKMYDFNYRGNRKVIKSLYTLDGERFANKLYTLEMLDTHREYLPVTFHIPDALLSVNGSIKGFTIPYVEGINLSTILQDRQVSIKEQIYYLKKIGEILEQLRNIRQYTPLKDIYINDLHESNFIVNPNNRSLQSIDLDSCKIGTNTVFPSRFLGPSQLLKDNENKYRPNPETNGSGYIIPSEDTDLYCYMMIILNYLYGGKVNSMNIIEFYEYMNYLSKIGIHKELLDIFEKLINTCHNENPVNLLDSLTEENVCRANIKVYSQARNKLR